MKSTFSRLVSGTFASWCRIGVTLLTQLCLVPVYLSQWDSKTYGTWLFLLSTFSVLQILDSGHSRYLANEFLRLGTRRQSIIRRTFWSACVMAALLGAVQTAAVALFWYSGHLESFVVSGGELDAALGAQSAQVLMAYACMWWVLGSVGGIAVVVLAPYGHYATLAWWGVAMGLVTAIAPAVTAWMGGSLLAAGLSYIIATVLIHFPMCLHMGVLFRNAKLYPVRPSRKLAVNNLLRSQIVTVQTLFEFLRQQGVRVILAPLAGATAIASLSTMRTGANVTLQGLQTVTNPLLPELMRFMTQREHEKTNAALASVWLVLTFVLVPTALILQAFVEPAFGWWTQQKIDFDPLLFALLTMGVLVYALAQPATAIVNGNNLLRSQLSISVSAGIVVLGGMLALVPLLGLQGAGVALLIAEMVSANLYIAAARRWLSDHKLEWPHGLFHLARLSVLAGSIGVFVIAVAPTVKFLTLAGCLFVSGVLAVRLWQALPQLVVKRVECHMQRLMFWRRDSESASLNK